jgi:AcrR family transcriptional regulator
MMNKVNGSKAVAIGNKKCFFNAPGITSEAQTQAVDRRVQRTRQLLSDALFQLIIERGYEGIAIQDITDRATIGRTTFYLHYQDKEELLKVSVKALMQELQLDVEPNAEEVCPYSIRCIRIFQHVAQHQQLYQALLKETGPINIGNLMRTYFAELFQRYTLEAQKEDNSSSLRNELIASHAAGSLFGLISWWLDHKSLLPAEKMGAVYFQLMSEGSKDVPL